MTSTGAVQAQFAGRLTWKADDRTPVRVIRPQRQIGVEWGATWPTNGTQGKEGHMTEGEHAALLAGLPVVVELPVVWGEMDSYRHVNNAVYFRYFESAR